MAATRSIKTEVMKEKVRFALACGRLVIRPATTRVVQLDDGRFAEQSVPSLALEREGGRYEYGTTRAYDPNVSADAEVINAVYEYIEKYPSVVSDVRIQLTPVGEFSPVKPFPQYDSVTDMAKLREALVALEVDLHSVMKYELSKDEPRDEVVSLLNKLGSEIRRSREDKAAKKAVSL